MNESYQLLEKKRLDYLISTPRLLKTTEKSQSISKLFQSYPIAEHTKDMASKIACSKTEKGGELIRRINTFLSKQENRKQLIDTYIKGMTTNTKNELIQHFNHHQQSARP